ncbi:PepSY domain-containing protein [Mucilaginibacter sp. Bleaf8]|uniref:PepSY-associated TM helix domain-containing protein n=1 Tax=Mucilaginibacter sp. Bleaf8 TaxID=2834430 RepID=UPI001BCA842E|nr:PepSY-associated TM helix domain-containing protein [Mucilaginibacter sp. Bleaf8]MBS7567056.1 PepSY domain-containing protein [Mucilaginibacter sp. Bleaf8]
MVRKWFLWLHKWLGLITGVVVIIVSLTGCINVFSDELKEYFYHDRFFSTSPVNAKALNFSLLRDQAQQALGSQYKISRCEVYPAAGRNWIFRATKTNPKAIGHWNYFKYYYRVYINPYTSKVVFVEDTRNEFFQLVLSLHLNLLLGERIGGLITGVSVACFFVILLSGLLLWWPKRWKQNVLKGKLLIKRGTGKKRFNYDLHSVLGFYVLIPALIICLTGLVFAFDWADHSVQFIANGGTSVKKREIPKSSPNHNYSSIAMDQAVSGLLSAHPGADVFSIRFREKTTDPLDIQVRLGNKRTHLFKWYYFDRISGKLLLTYGDTDVKGGEKLRSMNYDLHTGAFAGLPTKLLAFLTSLICASLPVTGFYIWKNKRGGSKKAKVSIK